MDSKPTLLITGVSGYVGSWCCKMALESGKYTVKGTVRDKDNKKKVDLLREAFGEHFDELILVNADTNNEESIKAVVKDVDYILHVAAPFPAKNPKDEEKEVIQPAINGNKYLLEACVKSTVKKVIITSSILTTVDQLQGNPVVDESSFSKENSQMNAYYKSKIRSEKFAFDFMKALSPEDKTFEMCTMHPGLISGPPCQRSCAGASIKTFLSLMDGTFPTKLPHTYLGHVDVRNVAEGHLAAIEKGKDGERYILNNQTYRMREFAEAIRDEYGQYGYKVQTKEFGK